MATRPELFSGCVSIELEEEEEEEEDEGEDGKSDPDGEVVPGFGIEVVVCCVATRSVVETPVLDGFGDVRGFTELSLKASSPSLAVGVVAGRMDPS